MPRLNTARISTYINKGNVCAGLDRFHVCFRECDWIAVVPLQGTLWKTRECLIYITQKLPANFLELVLSFLLLVGIQSYDSLGCLERWLPAMDRAYSLGSSAWVGAGEVCIRTS